ncbi:DUF7681 family protein [Burkholderia multivorans]|uniref:Acb2/Tad1 domain-containing protein n=1 Tax=Burkholderia multivorans TaxID=87883 RepID=UPI0021BF0F36|nr:hypothetical protein [Burkholderia multivorans]
MDNQHKQIKGYRDLTAGDIARMNNVKQHGEKLHELIVSLRMSPDIDHRWVAIAETQLQLGLMALTRAIAQPTSF